MFFANIPFLACESPTLYPIVANDLLWRKLPACVGRVNWRFPINCLTSQNVKFDDWSVGR